MVLSENESRAFGEFERRGWNKAADLYHQHFGALTQQSSNALLDAACVQSGSKVLDVATGPGYAAASAHQRGADVIGIDLSQAQVDLARRNYPGIEFQQGNAEHLAFKPAVFDAIVMGLCLLHLPNAEREIAEAFRVLNQAAISLRRSGRDLSIIRPFASFCRLSSVTAQKSICRLARLSSASPTPRRREACFCCRFR